MLKYQPTQFADPSEPPIRFLDSEPLVKLDLGFQYGIPPLSPGRQWLYEHRPAKMKPYVDFDAAGGPVVRGGLEKYYPGVADKITASRNAGYSDELILFHISRKVEQSLNAGYSDGQIERQLFYGYQDYGFWDRPINSYFYGRPANLLEKAWDYLGTSPNYETDPIKHELRAVVERAMSGFTGGLSDALQEEAAIPETIPGTIAGSAANVVGFLYGPLKLSKYLIGGCLAPTATGLRGIGQLMAQGGATLGLAGGISSIVPALAESEDLTDAGVQILESTGISALVGTLYPVAGAIPSKPLRLAVGLAALDYIRGRGEFTIDDVVKGIATGEIDREELADKSFAILLNLYFLNKVPSMQKQLAGLEKNAMIKRMLEQKPAEAEQIIIELRKANLIPRDPERFLDGVSKGLKIKAFGSGKDFEATYRLLHQEQIRLAAVIQADIEGKATIRIPKVLQPLAARARLFTKPTNFANAVRLKAKLTPDEKAALEQTVKGDLQRFWKGVQERDYLEKTSMLQHKSQSEKILDAMKTEKMYNQADSELQRLHSGKLRKTYQGVARAIWDTSANVKKDLLKKGGALGKEAVIRHDLIRGAGSKSTMILDQALHKIYNGLSKSEEITLNRIIQSRRTIAIEKYRADMKHPAGLGLKEHQAYLDSIPKDIKGKLNQRADAYFKEMDAQLDQLFKAGIITRESYAGLLAKGDYSPRRFIQYLDPERTYTFGGKKISVWDSGIKALDEGSYRTLENNSRALLAQVVTRTQSRIFRNEANRALYELAKQMPDNKVVQFAKVQKVTKEGKQVYAKPPAGYERLGVMINGQLQEMIMPEGLTKEWISQDPAVSSQMANIIGWLSGARILRPMATGINPEFALTNLPRDIAHAWITTYEYSSHMPIAAAQMSKDYVKVLPDTITRGERWHAYINEGGGMEFLTHMGRTKIRGQEPMKGLQRVLGYLGETSEIWTRLALRERALRNGKPPHEATWIARNYLDFSQGGWFIKGADTGVPYLNAGVQGTRGIVRAAKEKPGAFIYKVAEIGTLATGIYLANKYRNPECWESVSPHDKVNSFIITTPLTYTDEEGNTRHLYFKVAKDQGQKLVCTLFENLMAKFLGEEIDVDQVTAAAQELITLAPQDLLPPTMDAMLGYYANKDFWRNEEIWQGPEVIPQQEYRAYTHPAFVKLGELTGMSPERAQYALEQYFTYGNIYTSMVGGGLREIMDKLPEDVKEQTTTDMLRQAPFLRRVLKATDPYTQYAKGVEEAKIEDATRRYIQTRTLDSMSELFYSGKQSDELKVKGFIISQPWQDRERLMQRHRRYGRLYQIPDKRWWLNLVDMPSPEAAATVYWTRWEQSAPTDKKRLDKNMRKVPGLVSDRFMLRLNQLKRKVDKSKSE